MSVDFLDTDVFIYALDETDARKHAIAEQVIRAAVQTPQATISFQVVQETLNVLVSKLSKRYTPEAARSYLQSVLIPLCRCIRARGCTPARWISRSATASASTIR